VVVHDLDIMRVTVSPDETQPPLVIDANAVLPGPTANQRFQVIGRR
jgi:hypothetical protein